MKHLTVLKRKGPAQLGYFCNPSGKILYGYAIATLEIDLYGCQGGTNKKGEIL